VIRTVTISPSVAPVHIGEHRVTALRPAAIRVGATRPPSARSGDRLGQARPALIAASRAGVCRRDKGIWKPIATYAPCDMADVTVPNNGLVCALTNRLVIVRWRTLHEAEVE
jgi:hypothetical protein